MNKPSTVVEPLTLRQKIVEFCKLRKVGDPKDFDNLVDFVNWCEEYDKENS